MKKEKKIKILKEIDESKFKLKKEDSEKETEKLEEEIEDTNSKESSQNGFISFMSSERTSPILPITPVPLADETENLEKDVSRDSAAAQEKKEEPAIQYNIENVYEDNYRSKPNEPPLIHQIIETGLLRFRRQEQQQTKEFRPRIESENPELEEIRRGAERGIKDYVTGVDQFEKEDRLPFQRKTDIERKYKLRK